MSTQAKPKEARRATYQDVRDAPPRKVAEGDRRNPSHPPKAGIPPCLGEFASRWSPGWPIQSRGWRSGRLVDHRRTRTSPWCGHRGA